MTLSKQTIVIGIDDAKIFELTQDDGNALTYGAAIDVPGIQKIEMTPNITEKALRSDEKVLDYYVKMDCISWAFYSAKISLEVLAILEGGTISTTGSSPNQEHTYSINGVPKYFKFEAKANYSAGEVGDFHQRLYKCKTNNVDVQYTASDYAIVSASGVAIPTTHDGRIKDYVINETAAAIS